MAWEWQNDCVGCPQGCIHCNRGSDYKVWWCDDCTNQLDPNEDTIYIGLNGEDLCEDCYLNQFNSKICDDMDEDHCACCGDEAETLYQVDGEWLCRDCVLEDAPRRDFDYE